MPIHYYDYEKWSGFKITSNQHVRYLSCREKIPGSRSSRIVSVKRKKVLLKRAKMIEKRLINLRLVDNYHKNVAAIPRGKSSYPHETGVVGITLVINTRKGHHYPVFQIQVAGLNKTFYITKYGYKLAWELAVGEFAKHKGISPYHHLVERMPPKSQLKDLYDKYDLKPKQ